MRTRTVRQRSGAGFIYILRPRISINGRDVIKIGMTTRSVEARVRELTTGSMVSFETVYVLQVDDPRKLEKELHFRFRSYRVIGGGQEFFHVPAEQVIIEIEKRATEVSRQRAQTVRNGEMATFKAAIGATRVEKAITLPMIFLFLPCCFLLIWIANTAAWRYVGDGYVVLFTLLALIGSPILLGVCANRLGTHLTARYFEPRFGAAIAAKHEELRRKYPLAYQT